MQEQSINSLYDNPPTPQEAFNLLKDSLPDFTTNEQRIAWDTIHQCILHATEWKSAYLKSEKALNKAQRELTYYIKTMDKLIRFFKRNILP